MPGLYEDSRFDPKVNKTTSGEKLRDDPEYYESPHDYIKEEPYRKIREQTGPIKDYRRKEIMTYDDDGRVIELRSLSWDRVGDRIATNEIVEQVGLKSHLYCRYSYDV